MTNHNHTFTGDIEKEGQNTKSYEITKGSCGSKLNPVITREALRQMHVSIMCICKFVERDSRCEKPKNEYLFHAFFSSVK